MGRPLVTSDDLRVWMAIRTFIPGGGTGLQLQLYRLLPHLNNQGVHPVILSSGRLKAPYNKRMQGVEIRRSLLPGNSALSAANYVSGSILRIARYRRNIDVLHAHGAGDAGVVASGAMAVGVPALIEITRTGPFGDVNYLRSRSWGRQHLRWTAGRSWFNVTSSLARAELLSVGVPENRILSVPNGVDPAVFFPPTPVEKEELRARLGLGPEPLIIATSRLEPVKRLDIAIEAIRDSEDVRLLLLGGGSGQEALRRKALELGVSERVAFLGTRKNVQDFVRAADVFVLPSTSEGLANALLEAMACGLACVVSEAQDLPELVGNNEALVVRSADPRAWSDRIGSLIRDRELREELGRAASHRVLSDFTVQLTASKLLSAYRHILETDNGRRSA
jgi:glycosyltransferase involved in cell wall biosynthesis